MHVRVRAGGVDALAVIHRRDDAIGAVADGPRPGGLGGRRIRAAIGGVGADAVGGDVPIGRRVRQNVGLRAVDLAEICIGDGAPAEIIGAGGIGRVDHAVFNVGDVLRVRHTLTIEHDALGMAVEETLQRAEAHAVDAAVSDVHAVAVDGILEVPEQTRAVQPAVWHDRALGNARPAGVVAQIGSGAEHHGRGAKRAGHVRLLRQIEARGIRNCGLCGRRDGEKHGQREGHCQK